MIVYYSGTGSTKLAADKFEECIKDRGHDVLKHSLDIKELSANKDKYADIMKNIDRMILIYAVYAMDAPQPVYDWIDVIPVVSKLPTAVISVSGWGEVWPNTSCRVAVIKALERKSYFVHYENMIVMPSNWITQGSDHLVMHILNKMPEKAGKMSDAILAGVKRRTGFKLSTRILMPLSKLEKKQSRIFGENLQAGSSCNGCGWCEKNCPRANIHLKDKRPVFGSQCIICLRCIYGCPQKAITPKKSGYVVIKTGYDLDAVRKRMEGVELQPVDECCKGLVWSGVRKYLEE